MYKHILISTDGSELAQKGVDHGLALAKASGSKIATFYSQNRTVVPTSKIPKVMRQAIVAIEDRRFYEHHGVDPEALVRAVVKISVAISRSPFRVAPMW